MDLALDDDQQELRDSVRDVLARECPISLVRDVVESGASADGLWARMVELGWPALTIAEEHGGLGLGTVELALVVEELGRAVAPGPYLATVTQFVPLVRAAGSAGQRDAWLRPVAAGELTGGAAFDGVRATRDGDDWRLDGQAMWVVDGDRCDAIAVVATTDDGPSVFVVDRTATVAEPLVTIDASRPLAHVKFEGVTVGDDRRLTNRGTEVVTPAHDEAAVALAADTLGACDAIIEMTLAYVRVRHQFGVPVGSFQAVQHQLVDAHLAREQARAAIGFAAMAIAEDDPRRSVASAMAKAAAGDLKRAAVRVGIQLHGGIAYTWEHDLHLYVKRAQGNDALLGGARQHRETIADAVMTVLK